MAGTRPLREGLAGLVGRVRPTIALSAQAASGAALAWFLAHRVLHHPQPFFGLLHVLSGSGSDGPGVEFADDEVDHRDEVAVGAVPAGAALGCLDE